MVIRIDTSELVSRMDKVRGIVPTRNPVIDILGGLKFVIESGKLIITGTDSVYILTTETENFESDQDEHFIIDSKKLYKLAKATTKEKMTLEVFESHVEVKGNGKYKVERFIERDYRFPMPVVPNEESEMYEQMVMSTSDLQSTLKTGYYAISGGAMHEYTNGFMLKTTGVYTTDMVMFTKCPPLFDQETDVAIPKDVHKFIKLFEGEFTEIHKEEDILKITDGLTCVYCKELDNKERYPDYERLNIPFIGTVNFSIAELTGAVKRLIISEPTKGNHHMAMVFAPSSSPAVTISVNDEKAVEEVPLLGCTIPEETTLWLDGEALNTLLKAFPEDEVEMSILTNAPAKFLQGDIECLLAPVIPRDD